MYTWTGLKAWIRNDFEGGKWRFFVNHEPVLGGILHLGAGGNCGKTVGSLKIHLLTEDILGFSCGRSGGEREEIISNCVPFKFPTPFFLLIVTHLQSKTTEKSNWVNIRFSNYCALGSREREAVFPRIPRQEANPMAVANFTVVEAYCAWDFVNLIVSLSVIGTLEMLNIRMDYSSLEINIIQGGCEIIFFSGFEVVSMESRKQILTRGSFIVSIFPAKVKATLSLMVFKRMP